MESIEADEAPVELEPLEEGTRHGDFVGLRIDHGAAEIMLAGDGDGAEHVVAAGVARLLAIEHDEFFGRRRAAHLGLELEHDAFDLRG
jgi:hypothetical protein